MSGPASLEDFTDEERRDQVQANRLQLAEGQLRAARRAVEEHEQEPEVITMRAILRIEQLLIDALKSREPV
jgi:DNA-binding FrmR family transcriptional regulator